MVATAVATAVVTIVVATAVVTIVVAMAVATAVVTIVVATAVAILNLIPITLINLREQKAGRTEVMEILLKTQNMKVVEVEERGEFRMIAMLQ